MLKVNRFFYEKVQECDCVPKITVHYEKEWQSVVRVVQLTVSITVN